MNLTLSQEENAPLVASEAPNNEQTYFPENEEDNLLDESSSYGNLINALVTDPTTELTEDDIFRMKSLSFSKSPGTEMGDHYSAVSVVDSTSNFGDRFNEPDNPYEDIEFDDSEDKASETQSKDNIDESKIYGNFAFGRKRPSNAKLNSDTVTKINYPFLPAVIPDSENEKSYIECFTNASVYLVGTAHFSHESQRDVLNTILATQPDAVMVELCSSRISILSMDESTLLHEAKTLNRHTIVSIIRQSGLLQGILHFLLLSTSAHITRQLGIAPGGEFRTAHDGTLRVKKCRIVLGDRPIQVTLQRALRSLSFFQKIRLFFRILITNQIKITQEEVERCKNKDLLEELLKEMAGEFPQLSKIFVDERDQYMAHILHSLIQRTTIEKWNTSKTYSVPFEPIVVVAVVGIGHVPGILENWNKHIDSLDLLEIPKLSKKEIFVKSLIKGLFFGATLYGVFRVGKFSYNKFLQIR